MSYISPPLFAKDGKTLNVLMICRVSSPGEGKQREESNDDQEARLRRYLADNWKGPVSFEVIAGTGSGELIGRDDMKRAKQEIETQRYDLVLCEDLSRVSRRMEAFQFCEHAEDFDTRVIAVNGDVDTGKAHWRLSAFFSAMRHEMSNVDGRGRICRSQQNLFDHGGMIGHVIYGYLKPAGAKTDEQLSKDPAAEPIYREWFEKLRRGASYAEVADWLNAKGVPVGPECRSSSWDGKMVARVTRNPILKGIREWNRKMSRRENRTGKYRSIDAPAEMLRTRSCLHLAFLDTAYYDETIALLAERNAPYRRAREGESDPRRNVPRKRTIWPAQHMRCGVCGRAMYCQGPADGRILICSGATDYRCWNSVAVNVDVSGRKLLDAFLQAIGEIPDFDDALRREVSTSLQRVLGQRNVEKRRIEGELSKIDAKLHRLADQLVDEDLACKTIAGKIRELEDGRVQLERELRNLLSRPAPIIELPDIEELRAKARDALGDLRRDSAEVSRVLHALAPSLYAYPYEMLDGGKVVLRAAMEVDLSEVLPAAKELPAVREHLTRTIVVDLFEPPQREQHRRQVWELSNSAERLTEREIAKRLGITQPAVQRAKALQRLLDELKRTDPYAPVREPSESGKLRRHRHGRYQFEPLEGFPHSWPTD